MNKYEVKWATLKEAYDRMREIGYSEQLISVIQGCLEKNEARRSTINEITEFLAPYQENIRKGEHTFGGGTTGEDYNNLLQPNMHKINEVEVQQHRPSYHQPQTQTQVTSYQPQAQARTSYSNVPQQQVHTISHRAPVETRTYTNTNQPVRTSYVTGQPQQTQYQQRTTGNSSNVVRTSYQVSGNPLTSGLNNGPTTTVIRTSSSGYNQSRPQGQIIR